jgi:transcriptional regulator with XRE-family HTH domain
MWLDNLKELKKEKGMSSKQIADATNLPKRTVERIFSGDTDNPYVDTLHRIVSVLDGSLDDILVDTKMVVGDKNLATLQENVDIATAELDLIKAENTILKDKVNTLTAENDLLKMQLAHKEEIISIHNYYNKRLSANN